MDNNIGKSGVDIYNGKKKAIHEQFINKFREIEPKLSDIVIENARNMRTESTVFELDRDYSCKEFPQDFFNKMGEKYNLKFSCDPRHPSSVKCELPLAEN